MGLYTKRKVQSLSKLCLKKLENNPNLIIKPLNKVPYFLVESVVRRCTPEQLLKLEKFNKVNFFSFFFEKIHIFVIL